MRITGVEPRRKSLVEVFLDGESAGQVDEETALRLHIKAGRELTDTEWALLCAESDTTRARSYALWLLGRRSYSAHKLCDKLREQYSREAAEAAVARMQELGLIDDADYARRCASDLFRLRCFSEQRVVQELRQRGIEKELAQQVAAQVAQEAAPNPQDSIRTLLNGKFAGRFSDEKGRRRTVAALQRMGYRRADIRAVLDTPDADSEP